MEVSDITRGASEFSLDVYQQCALSNPEDNIIISPLSLANVLALLSQGAEGKTFDELNRSLHFNVDKATAADQFQKFHSSLGKSVGRTNLSIANKIFVQEGHSIKKELLKVAEKKFHSDIQSINFGSNETSAKTINEFVENRTNKKIKDLVDPSILDGGTRVVLANAIYFKGDWETKFNERNTEKNDFNINETESVPADFMWAEIDCNYGVLDDLNATALEMKYRDSKLSFLIVLPKTRTGLSKLESQMKDYSLTQIMGKMHSKFIDVMIPKFKVEFKILLNEVLKNMGMSEMFLCDADLNGILNSSEHLFVFHVLHKAFIEINEKGSEAAAASAVKIMLLTCEIPEFEYRANHPFLFYIVDKSSNVPIFGGRIKILKNCTTT